MIYPFLNVKSIDKLRALIIDNYKKYANSIPLYSNARINRAVQVILVGYTPTKELKDVDMQILLYGGLIGPNVFYEKFTKEENSKETNMEAI